MTQAAIDLPPLAAGFGRALHEAGVSGTPERAVRFARALALAPPTTRDELYWAARPVFVSSRDQIDAFDAVFEHVFGGLADVAEERGDPNTPPRQAPPPGPRRPSAESPPRDAADGAPALVPALGEATTPDASEPPTTLAAASSEERLRDKSFAELDDQELLALRELTQKLALAPPPRRTRRARADRHGDRYDLRATLRASRRSFGEPLALARRRRRIRPRRLVVLCDISGSMEPYSRAFVQFLRTTVAGSGAEAFVFATRLTRVTRALAGPRPQAAIDRAAAAVPDWSGGTRIGEALRAFNDRYGRRGMARGAVVVIVSDGWERDDPELLAREMERLRRLAYRIVWVNPRAASPGFAPLAGGMAAALPFCDTLLSGHSLTAMHAVAEAIGAARAAPPALRRERTQP
jgi:uncharacterized protein